MNFNVTIPIWGAGYVDRFLRFTLPTLRAPGNLPALGGGAEIVFYTAAADAARLAGPMAASGLAHQFTVLADQPGHGIFGGHGGTVMKQLFQRGFDRSCADGSVFVPVCGDVVYSDVFFASARAILQGGKRAVMTQGAAANVAEIGPDLDALRSETGILAVAPRELFRVFFRVAGYGEHMPTWPGTRKYPAQIFFPAGEHAAVMRCCHMYAVMTLPHRHAVMSYSHDNDLVERVLDDPDEIGWMDDSDQGFFFGLAEPSSGCLQPAEPPGDGSLPAFCQQWMSPWKASYFAQRVVWHDGEAPREAIDVALSESEGVVQHILGTYRAAGGVDL